MALNDAGLRALKPKDRAYLVADEKGLCVEVAVSGSKLGARLQPTFLMADVEIIATYELFNINRVKLENLIHRVFGPARLDIEIMDRFGNPVIPREWFLVPLGVIDEAVDRIRDRSITGYVYDPAAASLVLSTAH